ncbi:hypothetical protein [Bacteroides sedimenti]|uniref:Uncharacterized protein n=1 Tax=Bacteroides sedimenti TaxID=2136147 RepID=A0ABM8IDX1_9BACE
MKRIKTITVILFVLSLVGQLKAQISLAPSFVFIDKNSGVGNLFVSNNSQKPYEVTINFAFGYPGSDADGNLVMNYNDSTAFNRFALDNMIRAFPRSFILKGGEQRTVRVQVIPAERRKEGFFFTRMKIMAKPQTADVEKAVTEGIGTKISVNFEQVTAVFYHKGKVYTGITVKNLDVRQKEDRLELRPRLQRMGNAPFLGSMFAKLKDSNGKVVAETQSTTTVYFEEIRRMDLKLDKVAPGIYTLELSFESKRNDMAAEDLLQTPRIVHETKVELK